MKLSRALAVVVVASFVFVQACGGSKSSNSATETSLDASNANSSYSLLNAIEGLLANPDTVGSSTSRLSSRTMGSDTASTSTYSAQGCQVFKNLGQIRNVLLDAAIPACYIGQMSEQAPDFTLPDGEYAYYQLSDSSNTTFPEESVFSIRIGKFKNDAGKDCLKYQGYKNGAQSESFLLCETADGASAAIQHMFNDDHHDDSKGTDANANAEGNAGRGSTEFSIKGKDADSISAASILAKFANGFGSGSMSFDGSKGADGTITADLKGSFANEFGEFTQDGGFCAAVGGGTGAVHAEGSFDYPCYEPGDGKCYCKPDFSQVTDPNHPPPPNEVALGTVCSETFEGNEGFDYDVTSTPPSFVIDTSAAQLTSVSDCTVPSKETPDDFAETWDGTAPNGFVTIDISQYDLSKCQEAEKKREDHRGDLEGNDCFQKATQEEHNEQDSSTH